MPKRRIDKGRQPATNGWDVLKSFIDGIFNFISLSKVAALGVLWYIIRDIIYVFHLPKDYNYGEHLLKNDFLELLTANDNTIVVIETSIIIFLIVACVAMILYILFLRKEIDRISNVRSKAMHVKEKLETHNTSNLG